LKKVEKNEIFIESFEPMTKQIEVKNCWQTKSSGQAGVLWIAYRKKNTSKETLLF
jgi:hypothetical protein